jgi:hypothetical protein
VNKKLHRFATVVVFPFLGSQFTVLFHVFELISVVMQAPAQVSCSKIHQKIC